MKEVRCLFEKTFVLKSKWKVSNHNHNLKMNTPKRRDGTPASSLAAKRPRRECAYGENCYRRNPAHLREFSHPHLESILNNYSGTGDFPIPDNLIMQKAMIDEQLRLILEKNLYEPNRAVISSDSNITDVDKIKKNVFSFTKVDTAKDSSACKGVSLVPSGDSTTTSSTQVKIVGSVSKPLVLAASAEKTATKKVKIDAPSSDVIKDASVDRNTINKDKIVASTSKDETLSASFDSNATNNCKIEASTSKDIGDVNKTSPYANKGSRETGINIEKKGERDTNVLYKNGGKRDEANMCNFHDAKPILPKVQHTASNLEASAKALAYSEYRPIVPPTRQIEKHFKVVLPRGQMAKKHERAAPYYIFYTTITSSKETHRQANSVTFQELLDASLGELKCSLQINFMVDIGWLLAQYYFAGYSKKRLTILYGEDMPDLKNISQKQKHIDAHMIPMASPFGKHHTKLMLLCYEDGSLRVVISTANLYLEDWENRTQGLWMSPRCPPLPDDAMPHSGESPTLFKRSLLSYLDHYRSGYLTQYVERVRRVDMSHINVFMVASVPGGHMDASWGMTRVGHLLYQHCALPAQESWAVIAQSSSIGSYGKGPSLWLTGDFLKNFSRTKNESAFVSSLPNIKVIYPSLENVQQSHDGLYGGGCLPYSATVHTKQIWLKDFLHQWRATRSKRDRAMPHIKSYLRASPEYDKAAYYVLTSGNISKAAWGSINKGNKACRINNYEVGVMFLPRFVINKDYFPLDESDPEHLPLVYDLPPTRYTNSMSPWVMDYLDDD